MRSSLDSAGIYAGAVTTSTRATGWLAALCGLIAAAVTLAVAELIAVFVGAEASPLFAVGAWVIDLVPGGFKTIVIDLFGTADKAVLLIVLGLIVTAAAAWAGWLEFRRPPWGTVILVVVSGIAVFAVLTRAGAGVFSALPTVVGMVTGALVLRAAIRRLHRWRDATDGGQRVTAGIDRRSFVLYSALAAAAAVVVGTGSRMVNAGSAAVHSVRDALRLPAPASGAPEVPAGAELALDGLSPYITPNGQFYRIDTALQVPAVDPNTWKLRIHGLVDHEVELTWAELLDLPLIEHVATLSCVSNEVGGDLIGNALWLGYPIRELLARAKPAAEADMVLSRSIDGFTASSPLEALTDERNAILAVVGMNGTPLPIEHGFPVRMVVPGLYGYVSATKWVTELEVTRFADAMGYWTDKGWSAKGPIKTESRIDTPRAGAGVSAGSVAVAGVAWAPHTGITGVEVRVDGGEWRQARLADSASADTWRQWVYEWDAPAGGHELSVRATDATGYTQTSSEAPPAPDGATGWHTVSVTVH